MQKLKKKIREILDKFCNLALSSYDKNIEIAIYGHLLTNEETRMRGDQISGKKVSFRMKLLN